MRLIDCSFDEPAMNLALDEALLNSVEEGRGEEVLRFWESPVPFVVLGTAQKIAQEANEENCLADGVPILRRCSAGGCVLQGPGSLNYSLVLRFENNAEIGTIRGSYCYILLRIAAEFKKLGLAVRHQGISDLALDGRKVSGNAQKRRRHAMLHHGTLLYQPNYAGMSRYLSEPADQPEYRGHRSHENFVGRLPIPPAGLRDAVRAAFAVSGTPENAAPHELQDATQLSSEKYLTEAWTHRR
jgi:lipoate-protein ligase A